MHHTRHHAASTHEHRAPGCRCDSFNAQIMAPYKLTAPTTLKAFLTERFSLTPISFTDYKWLLTPDSSSSRGSALNAQNAELSLSTERAPQRPLLLRLKLRAPVRAALALLPTPSSHPCSPLQILTVSATIAPKQADSAGTQQHHRGTGRVSPGSLFTCFY